MNYLGIDLSKKYFDVTLLNEQGEKQIGHYDNDEAGLKSLTKWLKTNGCQTLHVCMEATNIYWEKVAQHLYKVGYQVSVVNPARIKGFAMSQLRRNKTDKQDSDVIVEFCQALHPQPWQPPSEAVAKLRRLIRLRASLIKTRTQQKNRLNDNPDEECQASLKRIIESLDSEIEQIEKKLGEQVEQHPELKENAELLDSIKGFGKISTWTILAEMPDLASYENAHAAAADAGVNPAHHESGETIRRKPKLSKVGKASIRGILHMPALTAIRYNPLITQFAERLRKRGKSQNVILAAVMRKLIHIAYGVLKHNTPFDPNYGAAPLTAT